MSADGIWHITIDTPMGGQPAVLELATEGVALRGKMKGAQGDLELEEGVVKGNSLSWKSEITTPMAMTLEFRATLDGDNICGEVKLSVFGNARFSGARA